MERAATGIPGRSPLVDARSLDGRGKWQNFAKNDRFWPFLATGWSVTPLYLGVAAGKIC